MPLCRAEVEQASEDDLVELSEIEKRNLGQVWIILKPFSVNITRLLLSRILMIWNLQMQAFLSDSFSDIDNTPQSLLSFIGNESVHGLYDFLLNYR